MVRSSKERKTTDPNAFMIPYKDLARTLLYLETVNKKVPAVLGESVKKQLTELYDTKWLDLDDKERADFKEVFGIRRPEDLAKICSRFRGKREIEDEYLTDLLRPKVSKNVLKFYQELVEITDLGTSTFFIWEMSLVYLVSEFESFFKNILKIAFAKKPEALSSKKMVTYEEVLLLQKNRNLVQELIEKETSEVIYKDINDIDKYIEKRFNIKLSKIPNWKKFTERFYRRNILIHNKGRINQKYKQKTGYKGKQKILWVHPDYLNNSIRLFDEMAEKISMVFYEKIK